MNFTFDIKSTDAETTAGINTAARDSATLPDFYRQVDTARYYIRSCSVKICDHRHTLHMTHTVSSND